MQHLIAELQRIAVALEEIKTHLVELKPKKRQTKDPGPPCPLKDLWNQFAHDKFPRVTNITPGSTRDKNSKARWKENSSDAHWTMVILRLNRSSFAQGKNDKGWVADFDFLVRPDKHNKILEGKYDDKNLTPERRIVAYTEFGEPVYGIKK